MDADRIHIRLLAATEGFGYITRLVSAKQTAFQLSKMQNDTTGQKVAVFISSGARNSRIDDMRERPR